MLLIVIFTTKDVDFVIIYLNSKRILQNFNLFHDIFGSRSDQRPFVTQWIVDFNHLVNVIELIKSSDFENVTIVKCTQCWFFQCYVTLT